MAARFVRTALVVDVPTGEVRVVEIERMRLALCNVGGTIYAVDDTCTHDDGPLGEGRLDGHAIECPRHGARFDVRSGAVMRMPAAFPIRSYPARVVEGTIEVDLSGANP